MLAVLTKNGHLNLGVGQSTGQSVCPMESLLEYSGIQYLQDQAEFCPALAAGIRSERSQGNEKVHPARRKNGSLQSANHPVAADTSISMSIDKALS